MKAKRLTEEQINAVVHLFPNHSKRELKELTGVGLSSIDRIQAKFGLRKTPEHLHNMGVRAGKASNIARGGDNSACYTPEAIAKRVAAYKERRRVEETRRRWGLEQLTKIHLQHGTKEKHDQAWYLRRLGYVLDERTLTAYFTPETHRARRLEALGRGGKTKYMKCYYDFKPFES